MIHLTKYATDEFKKRAKKNDDYIKLIESITMDVEGDLDYISSVLQDLMEDNEIYNYIKNFKEDDKKKIEELLIKKGNASTIDLLIGNDFFKFNKIEFIAKELINREYIGIYFETLVSLVRKFENIIETREELENYLKHMRNSLQYYGGEKDLFLKTIGRDLARKLKFHDDDVFNKYIEFKKYYEEEMTRINLNGF